MSGVAAGDETAMLVFVRRFQRRVFGVAVAVLRDEAEAADAAQEAFVRAWRASSSFDARRGSVVTWLLAIMRNAAIDHLRMDGARPVHPVDPETLVRTRSALRSPDDAAVHDAEMGEVLDALAELSESHRRSVVLAALGGYTAREISVIEDVPLGTAKTRIRDGMRRLRSHLELPEGTRD